MTNHTASDRLPIKDWQWLADQLRAWPVKRVHPDRTMCDGALRPMAADVIEAALNLLAPQNEPAREHGDGREIPAGMVAWHGRYSAARNMPNDVSDGSYVSVLRRDGRIDGPWKADRIEWHHQDVASDIIAYTPTHPSDAPKAGGDAVLRSDSNG